MRQLPDTPSITILKEFPYRGTQERYSNTYHFSGTQPANRAAWKTLADAIIAEERKCYFNTTKFVGAYGYEAGNENSVAQISYDGGVDGAAVAGNAALGGSSYPGDAAATIRWYTGASSSRGKKIYCRKYMHHLEIHSSDHDKVNTTQLALFNTFAAKLIDGTLPGSFKYCGPQGAVLSDPLTNQWITTRTLKRRGKRPPT